MDKHSLYSSEAQAQIEMKKLTFSRRSMRVFEIEALQGAGDIIHFANIPLLTDQAEHDWIHLVRPIVKVALRWR